MADVKNPALLPALKTKGKIEKGYDADFVVWATRRKIYSRCSQCLPSPPQNFTLLRRNFLW
jgi:dihydroorotase-like cyclic amidohydrolase